MPELSKLFVNPKGLLCLETPNFSVIDVGLNSTYQTKRFNGIEVNSLYLGFTPNVYSIYEDREFVFKLAQERFGLFENENFVRGLYSAEYVLTLIDEIINENCEE